MDWTSHLSFVTEYNSATLTGVDGVFEAYIYPERSATIVGWFIFAGCLLPIPLVYLVSYIQEYQSIGRRDVPKSIGPESGDCLLDDNDCMEKPRYLEAFTQNNLRRYDWGPMRSNDHHGFL